MPGASRGISRRYEQVLQPASCDEQPSPSRHVASGHSLVSPHEPVPVHRTSQAHAPEHLMRFSHELAPLHVTSQSFALQTISSLQESSPAQTTVHALASPQKIL